MFMPRRHPIAKRSPQRDELQIRPGSHLHDVVLDVVNFSIGFGNAPFKPRASGAPLSDRGRAVPRCNIGNLATALPLTEIKRMQISHATASNMAEPTCNPPINTLV